MAAADLSGPAWMVGQAAELLAALAPVVRAPDRSTPDTTPGVRRG